jgi:hypothetical protein
MRILTTGLAAAALLLGTSALTSPAFAGSNNNCYNNCGGNDKPDVTNNNYDYDSHDTYNKGGTGIGVGIGVGKGGDGGDAYAKGGNANAQNFNANIAKGGDAEVKNSGNSINLNAQKNQIKDSANNYNKNTDVNVNKNTDINLNSDLNLNVNKNSDYNNNKNEVRNSGNNDNKQAQGQGQAQAVENVGNVHIENERPPVNTAYSAALATSEDTCMGSSSIGGQAVSFGLTIGTTWTDDNCQRLKNSRQLVALGYHRAATSLMCFDDSVREAMNLAGTPCPSGAAAVYVAPAAAAYVAPQREYVPMAPVADEPRRKPRRKKVLPPK